ncbi:unnamed protein product, partial [Meganyctiphanes norvegica]
RDGNNSASPLIFQYDGSTQPSPIISTTNQIYIQFLSVGSVTSKGFNISWVSSKGCAYSDNLYAIGDVVKYPQLNCSICMEATCENGMWIENNADNCSKNCCEEEGQLYLPESYINCKSKYCDYGTWVPRPLDSQC